MCKNYSMSRNFNFDHLKDDCNIRVVEFIEKAESNQLEDQNHDEITYFTCISKAYSKLLYEDLLSDI